MYSLESQSIPAWCESVHINACLQLADLLLHISHYRFDHTHCYKEKILWLLLPLVMNIVNVQDMFSHTYVEISVFLTALLQQFTIKPVGKAKDVGGRVYGLD